MVTVPDSRCFIGMKQRVSWPWNTLFHPHSRCFMTMKHSFILIQGVSWSCFILIQHVSRFFTTMKQIVSLQFHPDSTCFITVLSLWFILFHADSNCFIAVSSLFHQWERALRVFGDNDIHADGTATAKLRAICFCFCSRNNKVASGVKSEAMTTAVVVLTCCAHPFEISVIKVPFLKELDDKAVVLVFYPHETGSRCSSSHITGVACTYFLYCTICSVADSFAEVNVTGE